jgi:hypothetical protein
MSLTWWFRDGNDLFSGPQICQRMVAALCDENRANYSIEFLTHSTNGT